MPRVFVGNFDFEHELMDSRYVAPAQIRDFTAELVSSWVALANSEDLIWAPEGLFEFQFDEFHRLAGWRPRFIRHQQELPHGPDWELVPWGWTSSVLKWGAQFGWTCPAPPLDVVKRINSRLYRWELESQLGVAVSNSTVLTSIEQVLQHIEQFGANSPHAGWVLKANFGMSGRERQLGRGSVVPVAVLNWGKRRLQQSGALVFEPWLERIAEAGLQVQIPRTGEPFLVGVLPLLTDPTGTYRGSQIQCCDANVSTWDFAVEIALRVAREVQRTGYFGPLGIDAMQYRDMEGMPRVRPLQDLNARYTMGRLGLGLRRFIESGRNYAWIHDDRLLPPSPSPGSPTTLTQITNRSWLVGHVGSFDGQRA